MIKNQHYYPDWIWKNTIHKNEETGQYEGTAAVAVIEGNRFGGKSVGVGIYALKDYFDYGYRSCFVTRYKTDIEDQKIQPFESFWKKSWRFLNSDEIRVPDLDQHVLTFKGHYAYIDGHLFAYPASLSVSGKTKTADFDNVRNIIFDEYISEDNSELSEEFTTIFRLYDTIARGREDALLTTKMIFISNCITKASTLKEKLGMTKEIRKDTKRLDRGAEKGWIYEQVYNKVVAEAYMKSPVAKALMNCDEGQQYLGYAQSNEFKDNEAFVQFKPPKGKYVPMINLTYQNTIYSIKYYSKVKKFYFENVEKANSGCMNFALTRDDHNADTMLAITPEVRQKLSQYKIHFSNGNMLFNSLASKAVFMDIYKYL